MQSHFVIYDWQAKTWFSFTTGKTITVLFPRSSLWTQCSKNRRLMIHSFSWWQRRRPTGIPSSSRHRRLTEENRKSVSIALHKSYKHLSESQIRFYDTASQMGKTISLKKKNSNKANAEKIMRVVSLTVR